MSEVLLAVLLAGLLADGAGGAALRGEAARGLASTGFDFAGAGFLAAGLAAVGFGAGDLDFFLVAILLECRKGSAACWVLRAEKTAEGRSGLIHLPRATSHYPFRKKLTPFSSPATK